MRRCLVLFVPLLLLPVGVPAQEPGEPAPGPKAEADPDSAAASEAFHVVTAVSRSGVALPEPRGESLWAGRLEYRPASSSTRVPYLGFSVGQIGEAEEGLVFVRPSLRFATHSAASQSEPARGFLSLRLGAQWAHASTRPEARVDFDRYAGWGPLAELGAGLSGPLGGAHRVSVVISLQWVYVGDTRQLFAGAGLELTSFGPSGGDD